MSETFCSIGLFSKFVKFHLVKSGNRQEITRKNNVVLGGKLSLIKRSKTRQKESAARMRRRFSALSVLVVWLPWYLLSTDQLQNNDPEKNVKVAFKEAFQKVEMVKKCFGLKFLNCAAFANSTERKKKLFEGKRRASKGERFISFELTLRDNLSLYCCLAISSCTHCGTSGITRARTNFTPRRKCCKK